MDAATLAIAFALTSVPAFLVGRSLARGHARDLRDGLGGGPSARLSSLMHSVGVVLLAGAGGMFWAQADARRVLVVAIVMALLVNVLALLMLYAVLRNRRQGGSR